MIYLTVFLVLIVLLGALSGGKEFGDTIRKGINTLVTLAIAALIILLLANNWDQIQPMINEWMQ